MSTPFSIWSSPVPLGRRSPAGEDLCYPAVGAACWDAAGTALCCLVLEAKLEQPCTHLTIEGCSFLEDSKTQAAPAVSLKLAPMVGHYGASPTPFLGLDSIGLLQLGSYGQRGQVCSRRGKDSWGDRGWDGHTSSWHPL